MVGEKHIRLLKTFAIARLRACQSPPAGSKRKESAGQKKQKNGTHRLGGSKKYRRRITSFRLSTTRPEVRMSGEIAQQKRDRVSQSREDCGDPI